MSKQQYTPEPWHAPGLGEIHDSNNRVISLLVDVDPVEEERRPSPGLLEGDANANRIVACVNACAGIPTYQLFAENDKPLNLGEQIENLRQQIAHLNDDMAGKNSDIKRLTKQRYDLLAEGRQFVTIKESKDGVWAHFRVGNGYAYSLNLSADEMSRKFAVEFRAAMSSAKETPK